MPGAGRECLAATGAAAIAVLALAAGAPGEQRAAAEGVPRGSAALQGTGTASATGQTAAADLDPAFGQALGAAVFARIWVSAPASTDSSDGLGPLYNARSCSACHPRGGRGRPPSDQTGGERTSAGLVLRLSVPPKSATEQRLLAGGGASAIPEPVYGLQLQTAAIQGHAGEGRLEVGYTERPVTLTDGGRAILREPGYRIAGAGYGPLRADTMLSPRLAPALVGLGLLAAVPEAELLALEDPDDRDGDGISGRAARVGTGEPGARAIGRFGWKAGIATLREQVAEAFATDMGLSSALRPRPAGDCTPHQAACLAAPDGRSARHGGHEVGDTLIDLVTRYVAGIAPPATSRGHGHGPGGVGTGAEADAGKALFGAAGCAACHRPSLATAGAAIEPFSDLLLHDMGDALADGRPEGTASGREWRTAPLWGIGWSLDAAGRGHLLHDGRARTVEEAILWHGGEARRARDAFAALPRAERERLIRYVSSL